MATNKQRRDAERLRLQRQLEERRRREATRKRATLIGSIVGTLVVVAAVVIGVLVATGDDDKPAAQAGGDNPCADVAKVKGAVTFDKVTVQNPTNLESDPKVCTAGTSNPTALAYKDLVVGTGATPALTSNVSVQYAGVLYKQSGGKAGEQFDSTWARGGQPTDFNLQRVVAGFTQGIGGNSTAKIPPMKVGGRRIVVLPSALGYGATGSGSSIPPNSPLVFVIDLTKVAAA